MKDNDTHILHMQRCTDPLKNTVNYGLSSVLATVMDLAIPDLVVLLW